MRCRGATCSRSHVSGQFACVHQIEMSPFLPFRNVTVVAVGAAGGREAPGVAQRPTDVRCMDASSRTRCFYRAGVSALGS